MCHRSVTSELLMGHYNCAYKRLMGITLPRVTVSNAGDWGDCTVDRVAEVRVSAVVVSSEREFALHSVAARSSGEGGAGEGESADDNVYRCAQLQPGSYR